MWNVKDLKKFLLENKEYIFKILKYFDFHSMRELNGCIMFGVPEGDSEKSCSVKLDDNLTTSLFSLGISGDLFGCIADAIETEWSDIIYTCGLIIDKKIEHEESIELFDGILDKTYGENEIEYLTYDDNILNNYEKIWNERFAVDNISPDSQRYFEIGYCNNEGRITIPWRDYDGKLIGIVGRANYETDLRYFPIIAFQKKYHLYGLFQNKEEIKKTGVVYIFESEKSVMQMHSYGFYNAVAIGCSSLSKYQIELLIKCGCRKFVLCHDESSDKKVIKKNIENIKDCLFMIEGEIGILLDSKNVIMPKDSKCSPSDLGKSNWSNLKDNYIRWNKC